MIIGLALLVLVLGLVRDDRYDYAAVCLDAKGLRVPDAACYDADRRRAASPAWSSLSVGEIAPAVGRPVPRNRQDVRGRTLLRAPVSRLGGVNPAGGEVDGGGFCIRLLDPRC